MPTKKVISLASLLNVRHHRQAFRWKMRIRLLELWHMLRWVGGGGIEKGQAAGACWHNKHPHGQCQKEKHTKRWMPRRLGLQPVKRQHNEPDEPSSQGITLGFSKAIVLFQALLSLSDGTLGTLNMSTHFRGETEDHKRYRWTWIWEYKI